MDVTANALTRVTHTVSYFSIVLLRPDICVMNIMQPEITAVQIARASERESGKQSTTYALQRVKHAGYHFSPSARASLWGVIKVRRKARVVCWFSRKLAFAILTPNL